MSEIISLLFTDRYFNNLFHTFIRCKKSQHQTEELIDSLILIISYICYLKCNYYLTIIMNALTIPQNLKYARKKSSENMIKGL